MIMECKRQSNCKNGTNRAKRQLQNKSRAGWKLDETEASIGDSNVDIYLHLQQIVQN